MISDGRLHTRPSRIFRDGYLAFKRGVDRLDNPYLGAGNIGIRVDLWIRGWMDSKAKST